ncbi:oligosaccharide flippase family protein [Endozoicomonas lisbonensis]|uniref:Lipopolysaccharide exporter n=1 Tax=Endozoicomonas lisbonensis TaxID=3120522 RepID=A0ABV2SBF7_9GAMM
MRIVNSNNDFMKNVLTLMGGTVAAQAIPVLISPLLTRLYSPEQFGMWALYMSITLVFGVVANGRYELAIMLPESKIKANDLFWLSCFISIILALMVCVLLIVFKDIITGFISKPILFYWLYYLPVSILLIGFWQALSNYHNRKKNYKIMAKGRFVQAITNAVVALSFGIYDIEYGLIASVILSQLAIVVVLLYRAKLSRPSSIIGMKDVAVRYKSFPKYDVWSALLNTLSVQLPVLLLSLYFNSILVGQYALAHRVLNLPISVMGAAVAQVFFQKAARLKNDKLLFSNLIINTYLKLLITGAACMSIITFYGESIFSMAFGGDWQKSGEFARYLSVWLLFVFSASPISNLYTILEKQKYGLAVNVIFFIARALSIVIPSVSGWPIDHVVLSFALTGMLLWVAQSYIILILSGVSKLKIISTMGIILPIYMTQFIIYRLFFN